MRKGMVSAVIALVCAAAAFVLVAGAGGLNADDGLHWGDFITDHDSVAHSADLVAAVVLAAVAYWRGLADA